jgi:hypothetical protein
MYGVPVSGDASKRDTMNKTENKCYIQKNRAMEISANKFSQMVWLSSKKVAFGVKSPWVVAWYCPKGNTPAVGETGSTAAYKKNVMNTCVKNGINTCYNKFALAAHN